MKSIVITGSTRGIGYGLAESFLARNCAVMVSGRSREGVDNAIEELRSRYPENRVFGHPCDVRDPEQLKALWNEAMSRFGKIEIWINNAGLSGPQMMTWELAPEQVKEVVDTNILGVIFGSQIAVRGMLDQGYGSIYNMEGMGGDGRMHEGLILYGMTKYGVNYFTKGLVKETKGRSLIVGSIRPGMVIHHFSQSNIRIDQKNLRRPSVFLISLRTALRMLPHGLRKKFLKMINLEYAFRICRGGSFFSVFFPLLFQKGIFLECKIAILFEILHIHTLRVCQPTT